MSNVQFLSVCGLEQDLLLNSKLYQDLDSRSGKLQQKAFDKINFLLDSLIRPNYVKHKEDYSNYEPIVLNTDILSRVTGKNRKKKEENKQVYYYREYLDELIRLGYIETLNDGRYVSKWQIIKDNEKISKENLTSSDKKPLRSFSEVTSRQYRLTPKAIKKGFSYYTVLDTSLINRWKKEKVDNTKNLVKVDSIAHKIVFNLCDLSFDNKDLKSVSKQRQEQLKEQGRKEALEFDSHILEGLKSISSKKTFKDNINHPFWYYTNSKEGRTFNYFTNLPSVYRKIAKYRGNRVQVIDMKSALPSLLILNLLNKKAKTRGINADDFELINDLSSGLFYDKIYKHADTYGMDFLSDLYELKKPEFKKLVLSKIFDRKADMSKPKEMDLIFRAEYPMLFNWMQYAKEKEGYKSVSKFAQYLESELFIRRFFKHFKGWALPVHDSIVVEEGMRDEARLLLARLLYTMFKDLFESLKLSSKELEALTTNFFRYE